MGFFSKRISKIQPSVTISISAKAKSLKNLSYGKINRFMHEDIGFNYRLPNISAAIGLGQFLQKEKIFDEKKRIYTRYKKNLNSK